MIVTKVTEFWKVKNWSFFIDFIVFVIVHLNQSLPDKVHLLDVTLVADNALARRRDTAIHLYDQFVREATLAFLEEMVERSLEFFEHTCVLDQIGLHLGGNLLIELELINDEVEIIEESLFNIFSNIVVKSRLNVEWLV